MTAAESPVWATHPKWCTQHDGFDDGSDDWHRGDELVAGGFVMFLSTGTLTREAEMFFLDGLSGEGVGLKDAEQVALAMLKLVEAARS